MVNRALFYMFFFKLQKYKKKFQKTLHVFPNTFWDEIPRNQFYTLFHRQTITILSLPKAFVYGISRFQDLYSQFEEYNQTVWWHTSMPYHYAAQRATMPHDATRHRGAAFCARYTFLRLGLSFITAVCNLKTVLFTH